MSDYEQWVLNGRALNDTTFTLEQLSAPVPTKIAEWVKGADSEGAILARVPKHENRVIEMTLRVAKQASMDAALGKLGLIIDELQECAMNENGTALVWTPADASAVGPITFRCLMGEIVDLPIDWQDSGWLVYTPLIRIRLTCLPFGHGAEVSKGSVTSSDPLITLEVTGVAGDVPALGRLVVTDAASQSRRWLVWGLESRWYPTSSPPSLIVDSTSMVTTGFAGVTATRSGAYSGASNNVIRATVRTQPQAICGLGNLTHVGRFRPHLRFYVDAVTVALRLTYQALDGPFRALTYAVPIAAGWNCVDLGLITVPLAALGAQRWTGRIEAYSTASGGETLDIDVADLVPAEQFGRARANYGYKTGVLTGLDGFTSIAAGTALNGRTATVGGTWATSGSTTDFTAADSGTDEFMTRATLSDTGEGRVAVLGATNYTDTEVGVSVYPGAVSGLRMAAGARYAGANDYVMADFVVIGSGGVDYGLLTVRTRIAGSNGTLGSVSFVSLPTQPGINEWYAIRIVVFDGWGIADVFASSGAQLASLRFYATALATGGALASGKPFFLDRNTVALAWTRNYDNFYSATPAPEPIVCYAGRSLQITSDTVMRQDATGTYTGPPPEYVGGRFSVPCAGGAGREARVAVMAKRFDVSVLPDDHITDSTTAEVFVTPRYLAIPR